MELTQVGITCKGSDQYRMTSPVKTYLLAGLSITFLFGTGCAKDREAGSGSVSGKAEINPASELDIEVQPGAGTHTAFRNGSRSLDQADPLFTTDAYRNEAFRLILQEANSVASDLKLPERLPIVESDLREVFVVPYGMSKGPPGMIGNIHTRRYGYFVSVGHKLSFVESVSQDQDSLRWIEQYRWPIGRMNTNEAYNMAATWMTAAHMDIDSLNRECALKVQIDPFANKDPKNKEYFVPIYEINWLSAKNQHQGFGSVASVKVFAPTKTLMSLRVLDSKYILRDPLLFTNLNELLSAPRVH
jgi:hypothetical protein